MNQPLGVVGGPVPTGGPGPKNKPGGVQSAQQNMPGPAAPVPTGPGTVPTPVQVAPNRGHVVSNAAQPSSTTPAGVVTHVAVTPAVQSLQPPSLQASAVMGHTMPKHQVAEARILPLPPQAEKLGVHLPGPVRGGTPYPGQGYIAPHLQSAWDDRKALWKSVGQIVVSSVLSIHNRSKLFKRALSGYLWQTMPAESWEILLVDDCSTEDLSETYRHLVGRINLRHIKFDHTRHPLFRTKNPGWKPGMKKNWFHTPALTINLGLHLARGPIISLCHPEILHAPENFELASVRILSEDGVYLFGTTYLGTQDSNRWLDRNPSWINFGWKGFLGRVAGHTLEKYGSERYWYTSFLPRKVGREIGGVDFEYLNGVAGEDDDFRDRIERAGYATIWASELEGFHQDHADESEAHRNRTTDDWKRGLSSNRALYQERKRTGNYPRPSNQNYDWTARECFVEERRYSVGSRNVEVITKVD